MIDFRGNIMKKQIIKSCIKLLFIFLVAVGSTYYIYKKFQNERIIDISSESLNVVFHDTSRDKIQLLKAVPVTDAIGLSSSSYSFDVYNNLTIKNNYQIKIVLDDEKIEEDGCKDDLIPAEDIRISIKVDKEANQIYSLSELDDGILLSRTIDALAKDTISVRIWVDKDSTMPSSGQKHYHGIIKVIENNDIVVNK